MTLEVSDVSLAPAVQRHEGHRLAGLDAARGILMLLGIVLHSANVYMIKPWRVHDAAPSMAFDYVNAAIHAFRMESFFWIAGFFAAMLIDRNKLSGYLGRRLVQLVLPLLATLATFNVVEYFIVTQYLSAATARHEWIGHLWFLIDLVVFTLVLVPALRQEGRAHRFLSKLVSGARTPIELMATLALISALPEVVSAFASRYASVNLGADLMGLTSLTRLLSYAPYFVFGMLIHRSLQLRQLFGAVHPAWLIPGLSLQAWLAVNATESTSWTLLQISMSALTWLNVAAVIALIDRCFVRPSRTTAWLADAAYPIYLSHNVFVVGIGTALLTVSLSVFVKFALVVCLSTLASMLFHQLCRRSHWLHVLFSGRPGMPLPVRAQPPSVTPLSLRSSA
ncbi:MAG: acyltransferase family protein [Burkholderiales bacterium]|nr:acyltransferase family protein [Burkholderiales bacterium]